MRERQSLIDPPILRPTLEAVRHQFESWRKKRRCQSRIPASLWQAAIGLCREHSIDEVARALRLNPSRLRHGVGRVGDRGAAVGPGSPELRFVRLDVESPIRASECVVELEASNGARMRMCFKGGARDLDPAKLSWVFWRHAR